MEKNMNYSAKSFVRGWLLIPMTDIEILLVGVIFPLSIVSKLNEVCYSFTLLQNLWFNPCSRYVLPSRICIRWLSWFNWAKFRSWYYLSWIVEIIAGTYCKLIWWGKTLTHLEIWRVKQILTAILNLITFWL